MSRASRTRIPPSCSLVSAYGPSVVATLPFFQYRVKAVSAGWSASPPAQCPLARRWSSYSKHVSNMAFRSASVMPSNLPLSKYPRQMYFIVLILVLLLRASQQHCLRAQCSFSRPFISSPVVELSGLQRPGELVSTEDDAGRRRLRADEL